MLDISFRMPMCIVPLTIIGRAVVMNVGVERRDENSAKGRPFRLSKRLAVLAA